MNRRLIPPAEAGGYFLKPATRAKSEARSRGPSLKPAHAGQVCRRRRLQEIDPGFSRGWHVPLERVRVAGGRYESFWETMAAKELGGGEARAACRPPARSFAAMVLVSAAISAAHPIRMTGGRGGTPPDPPPGSIAARVLDD